MAWNMPGQGILPAQAGTGLSHIFPESRYQPLPDRAGETAAAVQDAIKAITGILQKRQQDQIANQLLAVDNAPKAVAVDGTRPGSGTPDPVLDSAMQQKNASLGFPAQDSGVVPNYGGTQALIAKQFFDKQQEEQVKQDLQRRLIEARISKLNHVGTSGGGGVDLTGDHGNRVYREGYGYVTGGQAYEIDKATGKVPGASSQPDNKLSAEMEKKFGVTPEQVQSMTNLDLTDDTGRPIVDMSTDPKASKLEKGKAYISGEIPDGHGGTRHVMLPRDEFRPFAQRVQNQSAPAPSAASHAITKEEYDALPSGATYTAPDGTQRRKP